MTTTQTAKASRRARIERRTRESDIVIELDLDGTGQVAVDTGVPFYDHMLTALGSHASFDLTVRATGDVEIEAHHTIEDTAIALGTALGQALGDKRHPPVWRCLHPDGRNTGPRRRRLIRPPLLRAYRRAGSPAAHHYCRQFSALPHRHQPARVRIVGGQRPHRAARPRVVRARPAPYHRSSIQGRRARVASSGRARSSGVRRAVHQRCSVTAKSVVVLDYGSGNLRSAQRALQRVGAEVEVTADTDAAMTADGLVVPGVGAFAACMAGLRKISGERIIAERVAAGRPVLGSVSVCRFCLLAGSNSVCRRQAAGTGRGGHST